MTIRNRLKLIGLMPIIFLMLISSYSLVISYQNYTKAKSLKILLHDNQLVADTLIEAGKERSVTALYLGSEKKEFYPSLKIQRKLTDDAISSLKQNSTLKTDDILLGKNYQNLISKINKITALRKAVDKGSYTFREVFFDKYTNAIMDPILKSYYQINNTDLDIDISLLANTLSQFTAAKENIGLERGFISYYIQKKSPMSTKDFLLWYTFKSNGSINNANNINPKLVKKLNNIFKSPQATELLSSLELMSASIQSHMHHGDYTTNVMDWFALQTKKISLLTASEKIISQELLNRSNQYLQSQLILFAAATALWLLSLVLLYLGYTITKDITNNIKELEHVLNRSIEEIRNDDQYKESDILALDNIELDTHEGTKEAYTFLEALMQHAREEKRNAQEANKAKSLFLANMSHEIRTPLNGIVGFTEILKNTNLDTEQKEFLSIIDSSSDNLLGIINSLLDISKIENSKIEIEHIQFDAAKEFESSLEACKAIAAEKEIDLHYYMDPKIGDTLRGDPAKIKEILTNLLSNAIKFTGNHGDIMLEIERGTTDGEIAFSVQDNGIGITDEQQKYIFDAFLQADISITKEYGGTGLGLTISSKLVELLGGKLELKSTPGEGSKFFFSLPLEEMQHTASQQIDVPRGSIIGRFSQDTSSRSDIHMEIYFEHFEVSTKNFTSVQELQRLYDQNICQSYWIMFNTIDQEIVEMVAKLDQSKFHFIVGISDREKLKDAGILQQSIHSKPITLSKLKSILHSEADKESEDAEEILDASNIQFNANVLVAEDNSINQKLIRHKLEEYNIDITLANDGKECFEEYKNGSFDLVIMDIQMPRVNGVEATHLILDYERENNLAHIPIVALTANALKGDRERFINEGMDEYMVKPIQSDELFHILRKFLSKNTTNNTKKEISKPNIQQIERVPKILLSKKLTLSNKILGRYIEDANCIFEILADISQLKDELLTNTYDIVITEEGEIDESIFRSSEVPLILTHISSREEMENIIKNYHTNKEL